jgi:hypothetical protein
MLSEMRKKPGFDVRPQVAARTLRSILLKNTEMAGGKRPLGRLEPRTRYFDEASVTVGA